MTTGHDVVLDVTRAILAHLKRKYMVNCSRPGVNCPSDYLPCAKQLDAAQLTGPPVAFIYLTNRE